MDRSARAVFLCGVSIAMLSACGSNDSTPADDPEADGGGGSTDGSTSTTDGSHPADAAADAHKADTGTTPHDASTVFNEGGVAGTCKRGLASTIAPTAGFTRTSTSSGISWWYNWGEQGTSIPAGIEYVPMIWGSGSLSSPLAGSAVNVLGFNEPNFKSQSNLTPQQAAADWPAVVADAHAVGAKVVSPAVNFCGSSSDPSNCSEPTVTDPYTYLKDFFAACPGCEVDYVAVHWYNCDLSSLQGYIDGNGSLEGFVQFGKPIWLTEFSCGGGSSVADQTAYMEEAIPYLENNPNVYRYSWFSSTAIPSANLQNGDGSLTPLGVTYAGLAQNCP